MPATCRDEVCLKFAGQPQLVPFGAIASHAVRRPPGLELFAARMYEFPLAPLRLGQMPTRIRSPEELATETRL